MMRSTRYFVVGIALFTVFGWTVARASAIWPALKFGPAYGEEQAAPAAPLAVLGTGVSDYPAGPGQETARKSCAACHSADLSKQQRLTEKQWAATVDKMARWGAVVPADKRDELLAYLAKHFGPENKSFEPVATKPATN